MTEAENKSDFELKRDIPYVALAGEDLGENWSRYNGTALYIGPDAYRKSTVMWNNIVIWYYILNKITQSFMG